MIICLSNQDILKVLELAEKRCKFKRWNSTKWGRGLLNTDNFQFRTEFAGVIAEVAIANYMGFDVDGNYYLNGDGGDDFSVSIKERYCNLFKTGRKKISFGVKDIIKGYSNPEINNGKISGYAIAIRENKTKVKTTVDIEIFTHTSHVRNRNLFVDDFKKMNSIDVEIFGYLNKLQIAYYKDKNVYDAIRGEQKNYYFPIDELRDIRELKKVINKIC